MQTMQYYYGVRRVSCVAKTVYADGSLLTSVYAPTCEVPVYHLTAAAVLLLHLLQSRSRFKHPARKSFNRDANNNIVVIN